MFQVLTKIKSPEIKSTAKEISSSIICNTYIMYI